tara:strand:+ start:1911 stop:2141 length:231 start_codon:yes stop_codon:yes gene_type:complete
MQTYISLIFYCLIVTIVLYTLWQCVFIPIRKRHKKRLNKYIEVMEKGETKKISESSLVEVPLYDDDEEKEFLETKE